MTVTYEAPSNTPLPSRTAFRRFTATEEVLYACAVHKPDPLRPQAKRAVEWIVREGEFEYPYNLMSVREGNVYTIVRKGGWPRDVELVVKEALPPPPPAAVGGQAWGAVYEVDLTAQPSQDMSAAGAYTIDGKTWWAKGPCGGAQFCEMVLGKGLRRYAADGPFPLSYPYWRPNSNPNTTRVMAMQLAQLPGFNPDAPVALEWRVSSAHGYSVNNEVCAYGGVIDVAASGDAVTVSEKQTAMSVAYFGGAGYFAIDNNSNNIALPALPGTMTPTVDYVAGVQRYQLGRWAPLLGLFSGMLGAPDDYDPFGGSTFGSSFRSRCSKSPAFSFVLEKGFNFATQDIYLTHLRVLQPLGEAYVRAPDPVLQPIAGARAAWSFEQRDNDGRVPDRTGNGYRLQALDALTADLRKGHFAGYGGTALLVNSEQEPDFRYNAAPFTVAFRYLRRQGAGAFIVGSSALGSGFANSWELHDSGADTGSCLLYRCGAFSGTQALMTAAPLGMKWNFISLRRNAARDLIRLQINDVFQTLSVAAPPLLNVGGLRISGGSSAPWTPLYGGLEDVAIWDGEKTDAEMLAQYRAAMGVGSTP